VWLDCDVTFDFVLEPAAGGPEVKIVSFTHHFPANRDATGRIVLTDAGGLRRSVDAPRVDVHPGDRLVWRHAVTGTTANPAWAPNGDGPSSNGRFPSSMCPPTSDHDALSCKRRRCPHR
jgi:hypothetical protein